MWRVGCAQRLEETYKFPSIQWSNLCYCAMYREEIGAACDLVRLNPFSFSVCMRVCAWAVAFIHSFIHWLVNGKKYSIQMNTYSRESNECIAFVISIGMMNFSHIPMAVYTFVGGSNNPLRQIDVPKKHARKCVLFCVDVSFFLHAKFANAHVCWAIEKGFASNTYLVFGYSVSSLLVPSITFSTGA